MASDTLPGNGVTDGCELPCRCRELKLSSLSHLSSPALSFVEGYRSSVLFFHEGFDFSIHDWQKSESVPSTFILWGSVLFLGFGNYECYSHVFLEYGTFDFQKGKLPGWA